MRWKVELLQTLLRFMDPELFRTFERLDCDDLLFCHQWLLVSFKVREAWRARCGLPRAERPASASLRRRMPCARSR